ncbi:hypothetical protein [Streptomyces arenae]|uniref:hypothetical protein n=1 Tax=Streptomyces arenae TaxID=29301 RepID=UPI00265A6E79|nr:hypothetical protein [Streptomyces arenae]MCG7205156.1 hypothetical protein [Streptomyces arenae]
MGETLLIHPKGRFDHRAAAFAGGIAPDPLHTLAVVDLPGSSPATEWEAVARLLSAARYGSPRLVFGRGAPGDIRTACRHIADRLGREVLAADGDLVPTVDGGLFVPGDDGAAWLRFRPGHDPEPVAQRFPKPHWEFSAPVRTTPAGTGTVARPLPAGVWLHHAGPGPGPDADTDARATRHRYAVEAVPIDPHLYLVVLGSPGTPPLPLGDVARFWDTVLPGARPAVRFVLYGALDVPGDRTEPGQALADALGHPAVLYDGLPRTEPGDRTVPAGTTYLPTAQAAPAPAPAADDSPAPPRPSLPSLPPIRTESGDDASASPMARPPQRPAEHGTGDATDLSEAPTVRNATDTATDTDTDTGTGTGTGTESRDPVREPTLGAADLDEAPTVRSRSRATRTRPPAAPKEADAEPALAPAPAPGTALTSAPEPAAEPTPAPLPAPGTAPPPRPVLPATPAGAPEPAAEPTSAPVAAASPNVTTPDATASPSPPPGSGLSPGARPVPPAAPRFRLESAAPDAEIGGIPDASAVADADDTGDDGLHAPLPSAGPERGTGGTGDVGAPASAGAEAVRVQPVPRAAARALPPERGVAQERDWMRRTFGEQYNALAGSVSRVMSETPGLRGRSRAEAADALTDLVAVRLYLSGDSRRADAAVREAVPGPHVPLARCVTAGLRRLPSYRGPALLRTRLTDAERAWYREGGRATEWAFCHARTSLHPGPRGSGATDVLIWSMTARRTSSLDPAVPDRVVFLPGTVFKVLRAEGPALLMRELSPSEAARSGDGGPDEVTAKLDEIAVQGLAKILDALERAGTDAATESADPPGLIVTPRAVRTEGAQP